MSKKTFFLIIFISLFTIACSLEQIIQDIFSTDKAVIPSIIDDEFPEENEDDESSTSPLFQISNPVQGPARCPEFQIIEEDVYQNEDIFPKIVVYANAEEYESPSGFVVSYPLFPDSHPLGQTRVVVKPDTNMYVTSSISVECAGVFLAGDYITPAQIFIDDELVWEDFLYPTGNVSPRPTKFFYLSFPVIPPRPITITLTALAPEEDWAAYVPVNMFGFDPTE